MRITTSDCSRDMGQPDFRVGGIFATLPCPARAAGFLVPATSFRYTLRARPGITSSLRSASNNSMKRGSPLGDDEPFLFFGTLSAVLFIRPVPWLGRPIEQTQEKAHRRLSSGGLFRLITCARIRTK